MKKYIVAICLLFCVNNLFARYSETNRLDKSGDTMQGNLILNKNLTVDTNSLFVNSVNHRVGVGTIAPSHKLSVYDGFLEVIDPDSSTSILFSAPADSVTSLLFRSGVANRWSIVRKANTEDLCVYDYSTSTSCVMTFQQGGDIGISTDTPSYRLDVNGIVRSTGIISTGDAILDNTGTNVNSRSLYLRGDDGGVEEEAELHLVQGADPYLRISVDDDNTSPVLTGVLDIHSQVVAFVYDNACDIGVSGANRPKNIFTAGDVHAQGNELYLGTTENLSYGSSKITISTTTEVSGDLGTAQKLYHVGDADTYWEFNAGDKSRLLAGGLSFIYATEDDIQDKLELGNSADCDIELGNEGILLFGEASSGNVGISTTAPSYRLDVNGIIRSTGAIFTGDVDASDYKVLASSFVFTGSSEKAVLSWRPTEYAVRVSTDFNIAGTRLSFGDGTRELGCDGDDVCIANGKTGGNISFNVSAVSTTVKIKDVLNLNPISAPPKDNMPEGSLYYDTEDNQVYFSTSSTNKTDGSGWQTLNVYNHIRGGISCSTNTTAITLTTQNKFYQITVFKDTSPFYGVTPSVVEDHIEIITGGDYFVVCTLSMCATAKTQNYQMAIFKNNAQPLDGNLGIFLSQEINDIGTYHSVSMSGLVTFSAGDTVEVWIRNTDAAGQSVTPRNGHLNIIKM